MATLDERVRARDGNRCRWCQQPAPFGVVYRMLANRPELADDERAALLLCRSCVEHISGKVPGYHWRVSGEKYFFPSRSRRPVIDTTGRIYFELTS